MTDSKSQNLKGKILLGIVLLTILGGGLWWWINRDSGNDPAQNGESSLTPEQAAQLIERKNVGLGHLENAEFAEATRVFEEVIKKTPEEKLGYRNLAITHFLKADVDLSGNPQDPAYVEKLGPAIRSMEEILPRLKKQDEKSFVAPLLEGRFYQNLSEKHPTNKEYRQRRLEAFQRACELAPNRAHVWFELFNATRFSRDDAIRAAAEKALMKAYELQPNNLALLREVLTMHARQKDKAGLEKSLKNARRLAKPFVAEIKKRNQRYDLDQLLSEAIDSLNSPENINWGTVFRNVNFWSNLIKAETIAKQDLSRLQPHALEFVIADFSPEFYKTVKLPASQPDSQIPVQLTDATANLKIAPAENIRTMRTADMDLDGLPDLLVAQGRTLTILKNQSDQKIAHIELPFDIHGIVVADLDRDSPKAASVEELLKPVPEKVPAKKKEPPAEADSQAACLTADLDLVAYGSGGIAVLRNHKDEKTSVRSLKVVEQIAALSDLKEIVTVNVADLDHDSDLDLIVSAKSGLSLWSNRGDLTFFDISQYSQLPPASFRATVILPADFNRDVSLDIILAGPDNKAVGILENVRHGRFRWREFGQDYASLASANAISLLDVDRNASWDILACTPSGVIVKTTQSLAGLAPRFLKSVEITNSNFSDVRQWDFDNDGVLDLVVWNDSGLKVFRGSSDGQFQLDEKLSEMKLSNIQSCEIVDWDSDGDQDLLVLSDGKITWLQNDGGNANNWIKVRLQAEKDPKFSEQRCNIHGVGSLLELKVGRNYQPRLVTGMVTHFGLGKIEKADVIRALWTNGVPQNVLRPDRNHSICSEQKLLLGSCPYLYIWNGKSYEFFTDLLWAAPIGLQQADGVLVPTRDWEYLRIPGDKLRAIDGEYRMQVTEELWEAAYFDSMQLIAIDHPADVEIYSNEKVGPPSISAYKIHTVKQPRIPVAARDQRGRDVLPLIRKRDGRYLQAYDQRIVQGVTDEHFLELDFGGLEKPKRVTLFLTGWIFPTDPSINIAISQNPKLKHPEPPSLWVPDATGNWQNVMPFMGFPGGKTKTIAIDLSGKFLANDYRVRIKTTMELRWDAAFFTVDEEPVECRVTKIPVKKAELHYRGFSRRIERPQHAPENYDYNTVFRSPKWPPMQGRFTRYGDVTPLLKSDDDLLVVMGSGDEITVRFSVPDKPLPPGWKRDFFLRNVGWDKDANMNTVYGMSSEPYPFRAMKTYPYPADVQWPDSPRLRDYLQRYQTRTQNFPRFWKGIMRYSKKPPAKFPNR
ncbi:MAG: FG-GAP-like repeat-containing protein [Planctomycetaceae bacterium]